MTESIDNINRNFHKITQIRMTHHKRWHDSLRFATLEKVALIYKFVFCKMFDKCPSCRQTSKSEKCPNIPYIQLKKFKFHLKSSGDTLLKFTEFDFIFRISKMVR